MRSRNDHTPIQTSRRQGVNKTSEEKTVMGRSETNSSSDEEEHYDEEINMEKREVIENVPTCTSCGVVQDKINVMSDTLGMLVQQVQTMTQEIVNLKNDNLKLREQLLKKQTTETYAKVLVQRNEPSFNSKTDCSTSGSERVCSQGQLDAIRSTPSGNANAGVVVPEASGNQLLSKVSDTKDNKVYKPQVRINNPNRSNLKQGKKVNTGTVWKSQRTFSL